MIEFTVTNLAVSPSVTDTYQAEEGMTWGEWIESEYNTDNFLIASYGLIKYQTLHNSVQLDRNTAVYSTDIIIEGTDYKIYGGGQN